MDRYQEILELASEAKEESLALQAICACLIAEVSLLSPNPTLRFRHMTASLMGMADALAKGADSREITKVIERVCAMAEAVYPEHPEEQ